LNLPLSKLSKPAHSSSSSSSSEGEGEEDVDRDDDDEVEYASDGQPWMARSNLRLTKKGGSVSIGVRAQNPSMRKVIRRAMKLTKLYLIVGCDAHDWLRYLIETGFSDEKLEDIVSPLAPGGLEPLAYQACIDVAVEENFVEQGDIHQRFETGSHDHFVKPCVSYVASRCNSTRAAVKSAISNAVITCLDLESKTSLQISLLLDKSHFLYPPNPDYTSDGEDDEDEEDPFDKSKVFEVPVVTKAVRAAFFTRRIRIAGGQPSDSGFKYAKHLPAPEDEREISPSMLLMVTTAIASILKDHLNEDDATNFTGTWLDSLFKQHLVWLAGVLQNKPRRYHRIMNEIYDACAGSSTKNRSVIQDAKEILSQVCWDQMADE